MLKPTARLILWTCLCVLVGLLAACQGQGAATPAAGPTAQTGQARPLQGTLTFMLSEDPEGLQGFKTVVEAFGKVQPGVQVNLVNIPDSNEFLKRLAADFAARTQPDVFLINYRRFGQFAIKDVIEPLDGYLAAGAAVKLDDYYPVALDAFRWQGKLMCMPQNLSSLQVYYNKTLFQRAGVPLPKAGWTWPEFVSAAKALTRDTNGDGKVDQYGLGVAPQTLRLAPFIWAHGGELVDPPGRPTRLTLDSGPALEAFRWFVDLQVKERVVPGKVDEAAENAQSRFEHGTLGMFLNSRVVTPEFRLTIKGFEWDVAPLPVDKQAATILHSDGYCITAASPNKAAAWAFVEFMAGQQGQQTLVVSGRTVPSRKSVAESPTFLQAAPPVSNQVYLDSAPTVRRLPVMTTWPQVEDFVNKEIQRAFYGDATVEEAARTAVEGTRSFFEQNLKDLGQ